MENNFDWVKVNNDVNGNPRYVCHYLNIASTYEEALCAAKKIGGRKFHNKQYGGGIVFQTYGLSALEERIKEVSPRHRRIKEDETIKAINEMEYGWRIIRASCGIYMESNNFGQAIDHLFDLAINTDEGLYHEAIRLLCHNKQLDGAIKASVGTYRYNKIMASND